jgi:hypothetical protein
VPTQRGHCLHDNSGAEHRSGAGQRDGRKIFHGFPIVRLISSIPPPLVKTFPSVDYLSQVLNLQLADPSSNQPSKRYTSSLHISLFSALPAPKLPKMQIFGVTGESLGAIGAEEHQHNKQREPGSREILAAQPSVSVRKGIAWVSGSSFLDVSGGRETIVLSSSWLLFTAVVFACLRAVDRSIKSVLEIVLL